MSSVTSGPDPRGRRTALVTGASSGIGAAFAEEFARHGYDLVLTARREDRLMVLAARLESAHRVRVRVLPCDLAQVDGVQRLVDAIALEHVQIDALVNNAGYGVPGRYLRSSWDTHRAFLQVLVTSVTELTYRVLPGMVERRFGRIINVASLAGLVPASAGHTLYGASKAMVMRFSEALALEVAKDGVHVCAVCPGFTYSEFHDVNGMRAKISRMPSFLWMDAEQVARDGYEAVETGIAVRIPGRVNRLIARLSRLLPEFVVTAVNRRAGRAYRDAT